MSRPRILVAEPEAFSAQAVSILEASADVDLRPVEDLRPAFAEYDAVWMRLARRVGAEELGVNPRCKVLAMAVTGLDHVDLQACAERGVTVVSLKGEVEFLRRVRATSELAVGLAMALMRRIPWAFSSVKDGVFDRDLFPGHELFEKTAGVIGVGRLGSIVADYYRAFGMKVLAFDPRPDLPVGVERVSKLEELFARSDVVSCHVVLDESTRNLVGRSCFDAARPGLVFVNTARGGAVDETALLEALQQGKIAGAALDVLASEPEVRADDPLIQYARANENLLIVPHIGGKTFESMEKTEIFIARKLLAALEVAP